VCVSMDERVIGRSPPDTFQSAGHLSLLQTLKEPTHLRSLLVMCLHGLHVPFCLAPLSLLFVLFFADHRGAFAAHQDKSLSPVYCY
jgi:hypothetical protein